MKKFLLIHIIILYALIAKGYRIEIFNQELANTPVFLAGYYGEQVFIVDSAMTDAQGKAVFERGYELCDGMYTIVAPGKLKYDMLIANRQQLRLDWLPTGEVSLAGDEQAAIFAQYQTQTELPDNEQIKELRQQIIGQYPGTFIAAYLTALQPVEPPSTDNFQFSISNFQLEYRYRRRNFFANMPLSDVRLLRTPLYHETIHYFVNHFVTQHADSLIHIAYDLLEQASGNFETFFYVSDFMIDYCLRNRNIENINRFYNFMQRNRDMLGIRGMAMVPPRSSINYFAVPDEKSLQARLQNMSLVDIDGQAFFPQTIDAKYRVFYFWKNDCGRCVAEASRWQTILNRYGRLPCHGIAVNIKNDVQQPENRILAYEPLCVNASIADMPICETIFLATIYPKIIVTDNAGNIVGLFTSVSSLDDFLRIAQ